MDAIKQKATLFVDGDFLRNQILIKGEEYLPQNVLRYIKNTAQKVKSVYPNTELSILYYGSRPSVSVQYPISKTPVNEIDMKRYFFKIHDVSGMPFQAFWGRMAKTADSPWIMKPTSYLKAPENLTDDDFVLNIPRKGVLTKMVDAMAGKAALKEDDRLIVLGDDTELKYALSMTEWLGMPVDKVSLENKDIELISSTNHGETDIFDKKAIEKVVNSWRHMGDVRIEELISKIRSVTDEHSALLMLDAGVIRKFLKQNDYALNKGNVEKVLTSIMDALPKDEERKAVFYHAFAPKELFPHPKAEHKLKKLDEDINMEALAELNIHASMGQMCQSEEYPYILDQNKWFVIQELRSIKDFDINVHQRDVDDRIAYDMALARFSPKVKKIYLLATDGDFVYSVQKAKEAGIKVSLIVLGSSINQLSLQLMNEVDDVTQVFHLEDQLTKKEIKKAEDLEQHASLKKEKLRQEKRLKRQQFVPVDEEDIDAVYGETFGRKTKKEKIGQQRAKYRRVQHERTKESFFKDKNHRRNSR